MSADRWPASRVRCVLKQAHMCPHLWIHSTSEPILGDCPEVYTAPPREKLRMAKADIMAKVDIGPSPTDDDLARQYADLIDALILTVETLQVLSRALLDLDRPILAATADTATAYANFVLARSTEASHGTT